MKSQKGVGSQFTIQLTCETAGVEEKLIPPVLIQPAPTPLLPTLPAAKHILVVEDNLVNQRILRRQLEQEGHSCEVANNGQEAVDKWSPSAFDLIFMDIEMPVMGGLEATKRIREKELQVVPLKKTPIIGVSAYATNEVIKQAMDAGMDGYITKPYKKEEIYTALKEGIESRSELSTATKIPEDPPSLPGVGTKKPILVKHTFVYQSSDVDYPVHSVHLAGSFNDWLSPTDGQIKGELYPKWRMERDGILWKLTVLLAPGSYPFKYVINETLWRSDPKYRLSEDEYKNSILQIDLPTEYQIKTASESKFSDYKLALALQAEELKRFINFITEIKHNHYTGFAYSKNRPLLQGALLDGTLVSFEEFEAKGDGGCGFYALGVDRKEAVNLLIPLSKDEGARQQLAKEIINELKSGSLAEAATSKASELAIAYRERQRKEEEAINEVNALLREQESHWEHLGLMSLMNYLGQHQNVMHAAVLLERLIKIQKEADDLENEIQTYCTSDEMYMSYVTQSLGKKGWLGYQSALLIAKQKHFDLYIWRKKNDFTNQLELIDYYLDLQPITTFHLLHTDGFTHFNLLARSIEQYKQVKAPSAYLIRQTFMPPPTSEAEETEEEKKPDDGKNYAMMGPKD